VDGTNKYLLLDAVVADITTGVATWKAAAVDINAYPAAYYFLAWTTDQTEAANPITVHVHY